MNIATRLVFFNCLWLCFLSSGAAWANTRVVDHHLRVNLDPAQGQITVQDTLRTEHEGSIDFILHAGLQPNSDTPGAKLQRTAQIDGDVPLERWRASLPAGQDELTLSYGGTIAHGFRSRTEAPGKQQRLLAGTISSSGVFLDGRVAWYPRVLDTLQTFRLEVSLPPDWQAVSQGEGPTHEPDTGIGWQEQQPQTDIYLIAAPYQVYQRALPGDVDAQVYLRQPDEALAERYLGATEHYLTLYRELLGPYPYAKFALVENFWETGYGMPSFTLLGSTVIRLPFILHSSYPHEILHNWWGNGVYVDYAGGNWSEGLTTYLADHLINVQQGKGPGYRRNTLQRYASFVREENDFPLADFRARHNEGSQAVGYGKGMMLFHMLRQRLGEAVFMQGLRQFYRDHLFTTAGFDDMQASFEQVSGQALDDFFRQWLTREGAPRLALAELRIESGDPAFTLSGRITQTQDNAPFALDIPLRIYLDGQQTPVLHRLEMSGRVLPFSLTLDARPTRIELDPDFDLFRELDPAEIPSSLSELFGRESILFVLPSAASDDLLQAYRALAEGWARGYPRASIQLDSELESLDANTAVWLLGRQNRFTESFLNTLGKDQLQRAAARWTLAGEAVSPQDQSLVLTQRGKNGQPRGLVTVAQSSAVAGLARKLPHYGKYSYLVFEGPAPDNRRKGQWEISESPLRLDLPGAE